MKLTYNEMLNADVSGKKISAHIEDLLASCPELPSVCELAVAALIQAHVKKEIKKAKLDPFQLASLFTADPKNEKGRTFLHYVYSNGSILEGCCGSAYIKVDCNDFPPGAYTKLKVLGPDTTAKLPNFGKFFSQIREVVPVQMTEAIVLNDKTVSIGEVKVNAKYHKLLQKIGVQQVYPQPDERFLTFKSDNYFGVIMGIL